MHLLPDDLPDADVFLEQPAPNGDGGNTGETRAPETSRDRDQAEEAEAPRISADLSVGLGLSRGRR